MPGIFKTADGEAAILRWYDAMPFEAESLDIDTPAGPTHVLAAGRAGVAPIVLLHGMNMNAQ